MNESIKQRDSLVFYRSFWDSIGRCPDGVQLALFRAVVAYGLDQVEPDFTGVEFQPFVEAIWSGIRPQLEANRKRWENGCKGAEFGNRGGAPKGNTNAKKQPQNNPKTTPNVNDNENVNDNGNEKGDGGNGALTLPFPDNPEFVETWNDLRQTTKWKNKTVRALKMALTQLGKFDVRFAIVLMETAIAGNYQGVVFADTPTRYEQWKRSNSPQPQNEPVEYVTDIDNIYKYEPDGTV